MPPLSRFGAGFLRVAPQVVVVDQAALCAFIEPGQEQSVEGPLLHSSQERRRLSELTVLSSGAVCVVYNDVAFNDEPERTVWPDQRCPVVLAISEDGGKSWPWRRIIEHGEGFIGPWNDVNNRRYEYPCLIQGKDGRIHVAYAWGYRKRIKYLCMDEAWIRGEKLCKGVGGDETLTCKR